METILDWYFLTSSVVTIGPFTDEVQCKKFAEWSYRWKYVSDCWRAPLAGLIFQMCHPLLPPCVKMAQIQKPYDGYQIEQACKDAAAIANAKREEITDLYYCVERSRTFVGG